MRENPTNATIIHSVINYKGESNKNLKFLLMIYGRSYIFRHYIAIFRERVVYTRPSTIFYRLLLN
jgi:hypothetical protein